MKIQYVNYFLGTLHFILHIEYAVSRIYVQFDKFVWIITF